MLIRLLILFLLFPAFSYANCVDPIEGKYILVTSNPELLSHTIGSQKLSKLNYIYNHRSSAYQKTSQTQKSLARLNVSTLVIDLDLKSAATLKKHPDVLSLENDCYVNLSSEEDDPTQDSLSINDPLFSDQQWIFESINLRTNPPVSKHTTMVAVSDTGFEYNHPDLIDNIWMNEAEVNGTLNVDDDHNGCLDDVFGCDVTTNNGTVGANLYASNLVDHGTHVAGIIAAKQNNNRGLYGLASDSKLILVKGFSSQRKTTASDLLKTIYYAVDNGAEIINCSWGISSTPTLAEFSAFEYARKNNVLAIVAAGNQSIYASRTSPSGLTNVLVVGSTNSKKEISTFSNFGQSVDIYAPGGDGKERLNEFVYSLITNNLYGGKRGTSMAAPLITGILANIKSAYPQATRNELMNLLLLSADEISVFAFYDKKYKDTAKFINVEKLYSLANDYFSSEEQDLDVEPKDVKKPTSSSITPHVTDADLDALGSSSGCLSNSNNAAGTAHISISIFLILLPIIFLLFMRFKYKNTPRK